MSTAIQAAPAMSFEQHAFLGVADIAGYTGYLNDSELEIGVGPEWASPAALRLGNRRCHE